MFSPDGFKPYRKYYDRGDYHWQEYVGGKTRAVVDTVSDYIAAQKPESLLDIGCGDGLYLAKIRERLGEIRVLGIDNNTEAIRWAQTHDVPAQHMNAHECTQLGKFAAVGLFDSLEHMSLPYVLLDQLHTVTDTLFILNPDPNNSGWHFQEWTEPELVAFARKYRWNLVHSQHFRITTHSGKTLLHLKSETQS